jgi:hypothetical protein
MSVQPLSDVAKTAILTNLVRERHPQRGAQGQEPLGAVWAVLEEVPPETGWPRGYADVVALHLWPSQMRLVGYEVKASRGDLKRELDDLNKHQTVARYCDAWWLVVWDRRWVDGDKALPGIPEDWGLLAFDAKQPGTLYEGLGSLVVVRKAADRNASPWPRTFTASLVRRALEASVGTALARVIADEALSRGTINGKSQGKHETERATMQMLEPWRDAMRRECGALYAKGVSRWSMPFDPDRFEDVLAYVAKCAPAVETPTLFTDVA